ncbi:hypothetical protein JL720_11435 [Aureococcus anophagefferens]|nr:hypothetical protein JL720_11435 [Aureococcus anophagefferens]
MSRHASKSKAPSQPLWLTSVEGAAPRVEPPPAPPPPPPPPKPRTFRSKLACQASAPCRCRAPPPESCPPAPREASTSPPEAPLVSVICPTTLRRRALHGLLYDNFVAQDHERKELLVLDSGGADPSPFFAALDDPRVRYAHVPSDGDGSGDERPEFCVGAFPPRNKRNRLVEASGDVVVCMDDDNLYAPSYVSTMVAHLLASGHDLVTLGAFYVASPTKGADGRYASARGAYASDWWDGTVFADEGDERGAARGETMARDDTETGRQAAASLLACIQYVELNLVAVRKIVKKRDTVATRRQLGGGRGGAWLLSAARSPHLTALESFEAPFAALLATARRAADRAARSRRRARRRRWGPPRQRRRGERAGARGARQGLRRRAGAGAGARGSRESAANFGIDAEDAYAEAICVVPEALPPSSEASDGDDDGARALWCVIGYAGLLAATAAAPAPTSTRPRSRCRRRPRACCSARRPGGAGLPPGLRDGGRRARSRGSSRALVAALGNLVYGLAPAAPPFPGLVAALLARGALGAAAAADAAHRQYLRPSPAGRGGPRRYVAAESLGGVVGVGLAVVMTGARVSTAAPRVLAVALLLFAAFVAAYWRGAADARTRSGPAPGRRRRRGAPPLFAPAVERARRTAVAAVAAAHVVLEVVLASTALTVGRRWWSPRGAAGLLLLLKASEYPREARRRGASKRAATRRPGAGLRRGAAVGVALLGLAAADLRPAAPEATARSAAGYASRAARVRGVVRLARRRARRRDEARPRRRGPKSRSSSRRRFAGDAVAAASAAATSALVLWLPPLAALGAVAAARGGGAGGAAILGRRDLRAETRPA